MVEIAADHDPNGVGDEPLLVQVAGTPLLAPGLPAESIPGVSPGTRTVQDALTTLIGRIGTSHVGLGAELRSADASGRSARHVLGVLARHGVSEDLAPEAFRTLGAIANCEGLREDGAPVYLGDEIALGRVPMDGGKHWLVAGSGGSGVANADIILSSDLEARVTLLGRDIPPALEYQAQYQRMWAKYGPRGDRRLAMVKGDVGVVHGERGPDGWLFTDTVGGVKVTGDAYVISLGRTRSVPEPARRLRQWVRDNAGSIDGDLLFDSDDQYLGYELRFHARGRTVGVHVTGAASWQLPTDSFTQQTQAELDLLRDRLVPPPTGNAGPGFVPTAEQARALHKAYGSGDVHPLPRVPNRWLPADLATTLQARTAGATPPTPTPSTPTPTPLTPPRRPHSAGSSSGTDWEGPHLA